MCSESKGSSGEAPPGMPADEYAQAVEECFRRLRRCPLLLSPADFRLVLGWHEAGIPLWLVLETIETLFTRRQERGVSSRTPLSLAYCRRAVEDAWQALQDARSGKREHDTSAADTVFEREFEQNLQRARDALREALIPDDLRRSVLADLDDWAALDADRSDALSMKDPLARIDRKLLDACRVALGEEELSCIERESEEETRRLAPSADSATRKRLTTSAVSRRLRRRFRIPDLTLLGLYRH